MSKLSGYDSEAVGFDPVTQNKRSETSSSTQTNFSASGAGTQTSFPMDFGCNTAAAEHQTENDVVKDIDYPPGLNEFLRRVVPSMLEQLDQKDELFGGSSSDSGGEQGERGDCLTATLFQELHVKADSKGCGEGDRSAAAVLAVSWSAGGNSLAVSVGSTQHEDWCQHHGLIQVFTVKRSEQDRLVHAYDVTEKSCVSVVSYHPSVSALLAYGTCSGEVVLCSLQGAGVEGGVTLASPSDSHGSRRVSALLWAPPPLANTYLVAQIHRRGRRRGAADHVLVSAGSDATVNVWQVNAHQKIFEMIVSYSINASQRTPRTARAAPDLTCIDFIKICPLHERPHEGRKQDEDIFVVGTKTGQVYLCRTRASEISASDADAAIDPVCGALEGHSACVIAVAFSCHRTGELASMSADGELRVYDVTQPAPLKVVCLDEPVSSVRWLPANPSVAVVGLARPQRDIVKVYNVNSGRAVRVEGLQGLQVLQGSDGCAVTALDLLQTGSCRIAAGDASGCVRVFDLPSRKITLAPEDYEL